MTRNHNEIVGNPRFWGNPHCNDITFSQKRHNLTQEVRKRDVREISSNYLCKKEQPYWKSEKLAQLRISNSIFEAMAAYFI